MVAFNGVSDKGSDVLGKDMQIRSEAQASQIYNLEVVTVGLKLEQVVWHEGLETRACNQLSGFG